MLKKVSLICNRCHACKHVNNFAVFRVMDGASELVEEQKRENVIKGNLEEFHEYRYGIDDAVPNKDAIVEYLSRKNLIYKEI